MNLNAQSLVHIEPASLTVVLQEEGDTRRFVVSGVLRIAQDLPLDRLRLVALARSGERIVALEDTGPEVQQAIEGRLPFTLTLRAIAWEACPIDAVELAASVVGMLPLGAVRVPVAEVPQSHDLERPPLVKELDRGHVALSRRMDATDVNLEIVGVVPSDVEAVARGSVELALLDRGEHPLFLDESSFEPGFGKPILFRVTSWPKHGAWRGADSLLVRVRVQVPGRDGPLRVPSAAFLHEPPA
jgi:hypothetical protein